LADTHTHTHTQQMMNINTHISHINRNTHLTGTNVL